jgi:hypothetical protein
MKNILELIANIKIKILIMDHYMIGCKWKLNLYGNDKLHMYWTYTLLNWFILKISLNFIFKLKFNIYAQKTSSYITIYVYQKNLHVP